MAIASGQTVAVRMEQIAAGDEWLAAYSLLIAGGWATSLLALPSAGRLSDRLAQRGVGRRAVAAVGAVGMVAAAYLLMLAPTIPWFALAWLCAQIPSALVVAASSARLADTATPSTRGWAAGAAGVAPTAALLIGATTVLVLQQSLALSILVPALVGLVLVIPSLLVETPLHRPHAGSAATAGSVRRIRWLLLTIVFAFCGVAAGRIYVIPLLQSITDDETPHILALASTAVILATLAAAAASVAVGRVVRLPQRAPTAFVVLAIAGALPLLGLAFARTIPVVFACALLLGGVVGGLNAATHGLYLHRYAPDGEHGQDLGLIAAAETVPYVIVPLLAAGPQAATNSSVLMLLFLAGALASVGAASFAWLRMRRWLW